MDTSRTLNVQLLGNFRVTRGNDQVVDLAQPRLQFLLAYLLLHRDAAISRQQLAFHRILVETILPETYGAK